VVGVRCGRGRDSWRARRWAFDESNAPGSWSFRCRSVAIEEVSRWWSTANGGRWGVETRMPTRLRRQDGGGEQKWAVEAGYEMQVRSSRRQVDGGWTTVGVRALTSERGVGGRASKGRADDSSCWESTGACPGRSFRNPAGRKGQGGYDKQINCSGRIEWAIYNKDIERNEAGRGGSGKGRLRRQDWRARRKTNKGWGRKKRKGGRKKREEGETGETDI
jgi:hypothetical protein